jgi:hypothetical protein
MTERPNDAPDDLDETAASSPDGELPAIEPPEGESPAEVADEAPDLTDADLRAATEDAQLEVDEGEDEVAQQQLEDDAAEEAAAAGAEEGTAPVAPLGARARAEQARARAAARKEEGRARGPRATRTPFPIDPSLRIKDPASAAFVAGTLLVFVLIFLNAMAFGRHGAFTQAKPSASPAPSPSASPAASPAASTPASPAPTP